MSIVIMENTTQVLRRLKLQIASNLVIPVLSIYISVIVSTECHLGDKHLLGMFVRGYLDLVSLWRSARNCLN